jgi:hypothetical protein
MKRTHVNALIDFSAFLGFLLLVSTGIILEYQLPPGSGGLEGHGAGRGAAHRTVLLLWGWTRHDWGQAHYWIAVATLSILAGHIILHWKWITCTLRGTKGNASGYRLALGITGLIFVTLLSLAPIFTDTSATTRSELRKLAEPSPSIDDVEGPLTPSTARDPGR